MKHKVSFEIISQQKETLKACCNG